MTAAAKGITTIQKNTFDTGVRSLNLRLSKYTAKGLETTAASGTAAGGGLTAAVQFLAQLLAGLEVWNEFLGHLNRFAGPRIAADPGAAPFHRKRSESAQFNAVADGQRIGDFIEYGGDDALNVPLVKMRV
jgi:hypothetical protein